MQNSTPGQIRRASIVFGVMVSLTLFTYAIAVLDLGSSGFTLLVLLFAIVKAQLVADNFMGLRGVGGFWRPLLLGYLILLGTGIALSFVLS